jgi:cell division topological specificity factor
MFWGRRRSKETLKDRLQMVIAYDRAEIPPGKVEALQKELLEVINRYFPSGLRKPHVEVEQRGDTVVLTADIPVR